MVINSAVPIFRASSTYVRAELACIVVAVRGAGMHSLVHVRQPVCAATLLNPLVFYERCTSDRMGEKRARL